MDIDQNHSYLFATPFWLHSQGDDSKMKEYCKQNDQQDILFKQILCLLKNIKDIQISLVDLTSNKTSTQNNIDNASISYNSTILSAQNGQNPQNIQSIQNNKESINEMIKRLNEQQMEVMNSLKKIEEIRKREIQEYYDGKRYSSNKWNYFVRMNGIYENMQYIDDLEVIYRIYKISNLYQTEILQDNIISSYFDNNNTAYNIFARFYHFFMTISQVNQDSLDKIAFTDDSSVRIHIKKSHILDIISSQSHHSNITSYALTKSILNHKFNPINLIYSDYNHSFLRLLLAVIYLRTKQNLRIWRQLRGVCIWRHRDNVAKHKKFRVHFAGEQATDASIPVEYFNYLRQIKEEGLENGQNLEIEECLSYHQAHWPDENDFPKMKGSFFELIENYISHAKNIYPSFLIRMMTLVEHGLNQEIYYRSQAIEKDLLIGQQLQLKISNIIKEMTDFLNNNIIENEKEKKFLQTEIIACEIPEIQDKVNQYQEILQKLCCDLIFEKGFYRKNLGWYLFSKDANKRAKQEQIKEIIDKIYNNKELYRIGVQIYSDFIYNFESGYSLETIKKIIEMIEYCVGKKNLISRNFNFKCLEILVERFAQDKEMKLRLAYLINNCILVVNQKNKDKVNISSLIELRAPLFLQALFEFLDSIQISNNIGQQYQDFSKKWILSMSSQLLLQIAVNKVTITEDDVKGILERFSKLYTDKRVNEFQQALSENMPKELIHQNVIYLAYRMLKEEGQLQQQEQQIQQNQQQLQLQSDLQLLQQDGNHSVFQSTLKKQFLFSLIKYFIPMQNVLETQFLEEMKQDGANESDKYLLKAIVVISQKFQFEHVTSHMLSILLQNKKMDYNLLLRNSRNTSDLNQIFLYIKNASILKNQYINKKEIIKDIIQLQPSNLKGEVLLLLQPMTSVFLQNVSSAIRLVFKEHSPYVNKQKQLLNLRCKQKNYDLNLKKCERSVGIVKHQQDMLQQLIELLLSQEHQINDVIGFITLYAELLFKSQQTRIQFYSIFIKQTLPYLKVALSEKYKYIKSFNIVNSPLIQQIETIQEDKTDILIQQYIQIKCNSLDYLLQLIEQLSQHSNLNLKMNYFSTFEELLECEINGQIIESKQMKFISRYLICKKESISYDNIFQCFDIISDCLYNKNNNETKASVYIHDIGLCILTLALKIFQQCQNQSQTQLNESNKLVQEKPDVSKILKTIEIVLKLCPNERRFYSMLSYILDSLFSTDNQFIKANIELRLKNHFFESNSFTCNSMTIIEFSKKIAEVDLYQHPKEYFDVLTSLFNYNLKDSTIKIIDSVTPEFQFCEYCGTQIGLFEDLLEKLVKEKNDFYLCFIAETCRKYPTYLKNLVQWKYNETKDIFDFILENMIDYNYNLGVFINLLCSQNYSFYLLETGLIQGSNGYIIPTLINRTLEFITLQNLESEKSCFKLQGALNILKYLKPKFTYLDHLKLILSFIEFVAKQKSLQKLTLLERLGILSEIQASLKIASASELGDYKHAKYFFFRNAKSFLTEENRLKSEQFTKELKDKLAYHRSQDNFNLPLVNNVIPSLIPKSDDPSLNNNNKIQIIQNLETGLKLRYVTDKMNNKIVISYPREDISTYELDLLKYNLDCSESDEASVISFISNIKKNYRGFDGIDGDAAFKRVILDNLDISKLSENEKKLETIISQIFKLSAKSKGCQPSSNTKIDGKESKLPDNSSLVQELDEKLKTFKKVKDKLESESTANLKQQQEKFAAVDESNGLLEDLEEQQKVQEQQKQDLIKQYEALVLESQKKQNNIKKFSVDLTNNNNQKKSLRRQFQFDVFNFPANSLTLYQIDEETFYNSSHNEKIRMLNEGKQQLHYKNILKKLKISVLRESYSTNKLIAKFKKEKFTEKLELQTQFDANFDSFMNICNEHEKTAIILTFDQRYLKQLPEKWKNEALKIRKQLMNKGEDLKLQDSEEEEEKNSKEEEKELPKKSEKPSSEQQKKKVISKRYENQGKKLLGENDENSMQDEEDYDDVDNDDDDEGYNNEDDYNNNDVWGDTRIHRIQQISLRKDSSQQSKQKTSIEVDLVSNEIASMHHMSTEFQRNAGILNLDASPQMAAQIKNMNDLSKISNEIESTNKIEQSNSLIDKPDNDNDILQLNNFLLKEIKQDSVFNQQNENDKKADSQIEPNINIQKKDEKNLEDQAQQKEKEIQQKQDDQIQQLKEEQKRLLEQQKLLIQQQIQEQERIAQQLQQQEQELANNQREDYFDYDDFDAMNQQLILDQIAKEREEREAKKQLIQQQQLQEQLQKVENPSQNNKPSTQSQEQKEQESQAQQEQNYLLKNFSQSLPFSAEKEKKYSPIDFFLKSINVDSGFFLNILRLLINRGLDEYQEYSTIYLEILYILCFNPFNNYKVVQLLKGMTSSIILNNEISDKNLEIKLRSHYQKYLFRYENDERKANNQQCYNVFQLTQALLDYEIFNWYYFVLKVDSLNQYEEIFDWNYSILEKYNKNECSRITLSIRQYDNQSDVMKLNTDKYSLISLLERNINNILTTQQIIEKSDDYSVSITQLRQNYDATFNLILKYLGKFNITTNVYRKNYKQDQSSQSSSQQVINNNVDPQQSNIFDKTQPTISVETYPEMKFLINISNSFFEAYYTYSFHLKGSRKTSLKKMNNILYDLLRKKMIESYQSFEDISLNILKINREVLYHQIVSCNQFVKSYQKLTQDVNQLKNLNGTEEIAQQKRYIFHQIMEKNYENMSFQLGTLRRTIKNLTEIFNEMFEVQWKLDLEKEFELRKREDGQTAASEWLKQQKKELRQELLQRLEQHWMSQLKDLYVHIYEILYRSIQLMSEKLDSSKFTYDSLKSVVVLYNFFHEGDSQQNKNEEENHDGYHSQLHHIHQFKKPLIDKVTGNKQNNSGNTQIQEKELDQNNLSGSLNKQFSQVLNTNLDQITLSDLYFIIEQKFIGLIVLFIETSDKKRKWLEFMKKVGNLKIKEETNLSMDFKMSYLKIVCEIEAKKKKKNKDYGFEYYGDFQPEIRFNINRDEVWMSTIAEFSKQDAASLVHQQLIINFEGEAGIDQGGMAREWVNLALKDVLDPRKGLFALSSNKITLQPSGMSYAIPDHLLHFRFAGRLVGLALTNKIDFEIDLTRSFLKHILRKQLHIQDFEDIDSTTSKNLLWMLENDVTGSGITYSINYDLLGVKGEVDLIENGKNIEINESNKQQFVTDYVHYKMTLEIKQQIEAFISGFYDVIHPSALIFFDERDLGLRLAGSKKIDIEDMKKNTKYSGNYDADSPQIKWIWEVLESFNEEMKQSFIFFLTGAFKVPFGGFEQNPIEIYDKLGNTNSLPIAHTCFNKLELPVYSTKDQLQEKLTKAILEGHKGFHIS